jgi:short-subunit dehydrogenase
MKNILITGANRGIGLELTKKLAKQNQIFATTRTMSSDDELHSIENTNVYQLDLLDDKSMDELIHRLDEVPIDLVINNAGIFHDEQFNGLNHDLWLDEMKVNAISPISLTHRLKNNLVNGKDKKVVFISSQMGSIDDNYSGNYYFYRSSKAALNASAKSISIDWKDDGISVLILHPGWVQTDMGGKTAKITVEESVSGMIDLINNHNLKDTGIFLNYAGRKMEW